MNWKASLTGAVLVAAAGLGVGAAIGGKTTSGTARATTTVTVVHTSTITAAATSSTPTSTTASTPTTQTKTTTGTQTSPGSPPSSQYYAPYVAQQNDNGQLDSLGNNVSLDNSASTLELKGQTYQHAVAFDLGDNNNSSPTTETYQIPVPGFTHFSSPMVGLETNASAQAVYTLKVYKNNMNLGATVLYQATFDGPSDTHPMGFKTDGATDLVFDWLEPTSGEPDGEDSFIMADPVVTT